MSEKIPARYMHEHEGLLQQIGGPYEDGEGKRLDSLILRKGDVIMVNDHEVLGYSVLKDPRNERDMEYLGLGRVVKEEHKDLSDDELSNIGYQFHQGSTMWEDARPKKESKKKSDAKPDEKKDGSDK